MTIWVLTSLGMCTLAAAAVWRGALFNVIVIAVLVAIIPLLAAGILDSRGWALTPNFYAPLPPGDSDILGFHLVPNKAIYLWLLVDGEPRVYKLGWNREWAEKLQRNEESGGGRLKFDNDGTRQGGEIAAGESIPSFDTPKQPSAEPLWRSE